MKHHDERRLFAAQGPDVLAVLRKDMLDILDEIGTLKRRYDLALMAIGLIALLAFGVGFASGSALTAVTIQ